MMGRVAPDDGHRPDGGAPARGPAQLLSLGATVGAPAGWPAAWLARSHPSARYGATHSAQNWARTNFAHAHHSLAAPGTGAANQKPVAFWRRMTTQGPTTPARGTTGAPTEPFVGVLLAPLLFRHRHHQNPFICRRVANNLPPAAPRPVAFRNRFKGPRRLGFSNVPKFKWPRLGRARTRGRRQSAPPARLSACRPAGAGLGGATPGCTIQNNTICRAWCAHPAGCFLPITWPFKCPPSGRMRAPDREAPVGRLWPRSVNFFSASSWACGARL